MPIGAITSDLDVAEVVLSAFFLFFLGLVYHLRQEDKREGYPAVDDVTGKRLLGFPVPPSPKTFRLLDGGKATTPRIDPPQPIAARPLHPFPGAPITPTGDPLRDGVGPAAYAQRRDEPLIFGEGKIQMLPMRALQGWHVFEGATDPRGMSVISADGVNVGTVRDLWIDRSVKILRYLELELAASGGPALVPIYYTNIKADRRRILVKALRAAQFEQTPGLREPDSITAREEDRLNAYYAGAAFYGRRYVSGFAV
jgi:photosynthetic reaction center H subunit